MLRLVGGARPSAGPGGGQFLSDPLATVIAMSTTPAPIDPKQLERVRALLAKAEATQFPEEAAAYTAKAQELMARYSIDAAMLRDAQGAAAGGAAGRVITVEDPYARAKSVLLACIAAANHSMVVWSQARREATVFGFPVDGANIELLYTSLLLQATQEMLEAGRQVDGVGRSRTRSFRSSFLVSFAYRVGERLEEATEQATAAAEAVHGASLLPVLARQEEAVRTARDEAFPKLRSQRVTTSNMGGYVAGRAAADRANLHHGRMLDARR